MKPFIRYYQGRRWFVIPDGSGGRMVVIYPRGREEPDLDVTQISVKSYGTLPDVRP